MRSGDDDDRNCPEQLVIRKRLRGGEVGGGQGWVHSRGVWPRCPGWDPVLPFASRAMCVSVCVPQWPRP